ncbi:MAG TPA: NUDIX hydrolase, partial [Candidatus Dormibacteraeota bacterium]
IDDITYWYERGGTRVRKVVSFFLFSYRSGSVRDHDHEVDSAEWVPLAEAPKLLSYRGEKKVAAAAQSRWGRGR